MVLQGSASDRDLLMEENIADADIFLALTNDEAISGRTVFNAGAGIYLPVDKKVVKDATLRLNVDNLFDKKYLDGVYTTKTNAASYSGFRDGDPAYIVGLERTVTVSLEANF